MHPSLRIPRVLADFLGVRASARVHLAPEGPRKFSVEVGVLGEESEG